MAGGKVPLSDKSTGDSEWVTVTPKRAQEGLLADAFERGSFRVALGTAVFWKATDYNGGEYALMRGTAKSVAIPSASHKTGLLARKRIGMFHQQRSCAGGAWGLCPILRYPA
jgi:hypothetical protein